MVNNSERESANALENFKSTQNGPGLSRGVERQHTEQFYMF